MNPDEYLNALLALPQLHGALVSPDAAWVAWTWFGAGPAADVYAAPTDGSAPPVRLTDTPDNTFGVSWTPDNAALIVGQDHEGDERVRLFRVDLAQPVVMTPLTEANPPYFLHGDQLHPDGRRLIYAANYDVAAGAEIEPTWVYCHDLVTGERRPLARPLKAGHPQPALNEQGTHILYNRQDLDPAGNQVWLVDIDGADDREILNFGPAVKARASWFPDGRRVLVVAEHGAYRRVGVCDRGDGSLRWLLDDPARNIEWAFVPAYTDGAVAVIVEVQQARSHASLLDTATGAETRLPDTPGDLIPLRPLPGGEWLVFYNSSRSPGDIVRTRLDPPRPEAFRSLTRIWDRTPLRPADLTPAESITWQAGDGLAIQGWLYRAAAPALGLIVHVHGGPTGHSADAISPEIQYYVARGFHVLDPNYRGSTGFGIAYRDAIKVDGWGGREQDDIRDGVAALVEAGLVEPGKVGITGTSYGGYSSWCAITRWPPRVFAAAAPICGMTDLVVDYETTRPDLRPYSEEMMGGRPDQVPDRYRERSPIHFVANIRGRLLIVQGARDPNVTPANVAAVRQALDAAGIPYELLVFPDEGHGISRPENKRVLYTRLAAFFAGAFAAAGSQPDA